jgi:hypothetical protein
MLCGCSTRTPTANGFGASANTGVQQHLVGVPRALTNGEHERRAVESLFRSVLPNANARNASVFAFQPNERRAKAHLAAEPLNFTAQVRNYGSEPVGADVRFCQYRNLLRRAECNERFEYRVPARVLAARGQFPVRKVPAPPSPNITLLSSSSSPSRQ